VGPANRGLLYVIWRSPSPAPCRCLHGWEDNVRIYNPDAVVCCVATIGCDSDTRGGRADPPRRCLHAHCSSARLGSLVTAHHYAARGAVTGLQAAGAQYTVTRRAALETGGLTVVSAYLPRVSVADHFF
jgi:hypothetical protein